MIVFLLSVLFCFWLGKHIAYDLYESHNMICIFDPGAITIEASYSVLKKAIRSFLKASFFLVLAIQLLIPGQSFSSDSSDPHALIKGISQSHQVIILGERHRRPESTDLFQKIADSLTQDGNCLAVGLEIDSDQNRHLDNPESMGKIQVSSIIKHDGFTRMLQKLVQLSQDRCLKLYGLDLPSRLWKEETTRDEWMAMQVMEMLKQESSSPILVLAGNFHAVKESLWEDEKDRPSLAEILIRQKVRVFSIIQAWDKNQCPDNHAVWMNSKEEAAHAIFTDLLSIRSVILPDDLSVIADAAILWSCTER